MREPVAAEQPSPTTIDPAEVARFDAIARTWWDTAGPMAVLHKFNPVRVAYIRDAAAAHFARDITGLEPLKGLSIVDVGCGGGVLSEPLARLGSDVLGLDPAPTNIAVAKRRAEAVNGSARFKEGTIEAEVATGARFDIVLAMEVVEHVANVEAFVAACCTAVKPGGLLVMATLNRTIRAYALAILAAEYVLRWLPKGTHDWNRFVTPSELSDAISAQGLAVAETKGVVFNPLSDAWSLSSDTAVNYMVLARKPAARKAG
jgi:2-polyprenyl-6-hydroxyphenyl methylase / 3-demethylubiquinone-9 3-methyltransferase